MRRFLHATLLWLSVPFLLLSAASLGIFTRLAVRADRVMPDARYGNCFTYAAARWDRLGGLVGMRAAHEITLAGMRIPHAIWQAWLGGPVRMTYPRHRYVGRLPWRSILFDFDVYCSDTPDSAERWVESSVPAAWKPTQPPVI